MSRRITWALVLGIALSLAALIAMQDADPIARVLRNDIGSVVVKVVLLVFVGALAIAMYRDRLRKAIEAIAFWLVIAAVLFVGYTYRFELRDVFDRVAAELVPGYVASQGQNAEIVRGRDGDFQLTAHVNGARVPMIVDTGASSVVLTQEAAKASGLPIEILTYTVNVDTANGRTRAAPVTLERVVVGGVVERSVPALVAQQGQLKQSLLGMSFLNRLAGWEVRGDKLRLRGAP